ncbi:MULTISPECIES: hypothetical protein [Photorhabdus]|nr:hypothetical protein [Photorhabdus luminescens]
MMFKGVIRLSEQLNGDGEVIAISLVEIKQVSMADRDIQRQRRI